MRPTYSARFFSIIATAVFACSAAADDGKDAEIDELRSEVSQLRDTVAELRSTVQEFKAGDDWLTQQRADEIRGLVRDVLADADTRASLLQDGMTAGWDKGFFLGSADGNFLLRLGGQIQVRYAAGFQDKAPDGEDERYGFEVRRAKLKLKGHVVDPTWKYVLNLAWDHDDSGRQGDVDVEDAIIIKDFGGGWELWAGQFKLNFLREELTSSTSQLAVDRSYVNELYNQDRHQGVQVFYTTDQFRVTGAFGDGFGSKNLPAYAITTEWAATARLEWLAMGNWNQFKDFTSPPGSDTGLMVGAAIHWQDDKYDQPLTGKVERLTWTIDGSLEGAGWNLFAYVVGNHTDPDVGSSMDQIGVVVQGGYYFTDDWEGFARYEWSDLDTPGLDDVSILTVGFNRYYAKHTLKWTTDLGYAFDSVPINELGINWRADDQTEDGQIVIRSQLQLLF
jgi:phosphate-selective porin OprO/OprP